MNLRGSFDGKKRVRKSYRALRVFLFLAAFTLVFTLFYNGFSGPITGKVTLETIKTFEGRILEGQLKIIFSPGELISQDSKVFVRYADREVAVALSELMGSHETYEGDFYATGADLSGSGKGYGKPGLNVDGSEGFGESYSQGEPLEVSLDLSRFGLIARKDAGIVARIVHEDGIPLASVRSDVKVIRLDANVIRTINPSRISQSPALENVEVEVSHGPVSVGDEVVTWTKRITLPEDKFANRLDVELPSGAENVRVASIAYALDRGIVGSEKIYVNADGTEERVEIDGEPEGEETEEVEGVQYLGNLRAGINGDVILVLEAKRDREKFSFKKLFEGVKSFLTGNSISEFEDESEIISADNVNELVLKYETRGPTKIESETDEGKMVEVIGLNDAHFNGVLVSTEVGNVNPDKVKIYELDGEERKEVDFELSEGTVYWRTDLSVKTFIIVITGAEHLDSERNFISNIYSEVFELDDVWSEEIFDGEYVRVTFEKNLTSVNDITVYPRVTSGNPRIEIYEEDGSEVIAEFESLANNEYNKVFLDDLVGEQDTFDLRILGGSVEFDHIIDPNPPGGGSGGSGLGQNKFFEDCSSGVNEWTTTGGWSIDGGSCDHFFADFSGENNLTSTSINLSSADNATLSFNWSLVPEEGVTIEFKIFVEDGNEVPVEVFTDTVSGGSVQSGYELINLSDYISLTSTVRVIGVCSVVGTTSAEPGGCSWDNISVNDVSGATSSCGELNESGRFYYLTGDVSTTGTCFTVSANNVTLDGNGYTIIYGNSTSNTDFYGVFSSVNETQARNFHVRRGSLATTSQNRYGVFFSGYDGIVDDVNATLNRYGIYLSGGQSHEIKNVVANSNSQDGITLSSGNILTNITAESNAQYGVFLSSDSNNVLTNVSSVSNSGGGFFMTLDSENNSFSEIVSSSNSGFGIFLSFSSDNNSFTDLDLDSNSDYGIRLANSLNNSFTDVVIQNTSGDAFSIGASSSDSILRNVSVIDTDASFYDLEYEGAISGTELIDSSFGNYTFGSTGGTLVVEDTTYGEIRFLSAVNGSGTNLSGDILIVNNSVTVRSDVNSGLNKSANITLYGIGDRGFESPRILRDGVKCETGCYNFTSLTASTVIFNVSHWTNYSVGDKPAGIVHTFVNNTRGDINITNGTEIWLNATLVQGEGDIQLWLYDIVLDSYTLLDEGPSPLANLTLFDLNEWQYRVIGNYSGNENYTSGSESWSIDVDSEHGGQEPDPEPDPPSGGGGGRTIPPASTPECEPLGEVDVGECIDGNVTIIYRDSCGENITQTVSCEDYFICDEVYDCETWSECTDGMQHRKCDIAFTEMCGYSIERECSLPGSEGGFSSILANLREGIGLIIFIVFMAAGILVLSVRLVLEPSNRISWLIYAGERALKSGNHNRAVRNYVAVKKIYNKLPEDKKKGKLKERSMNYYSKVKGFLNN